MSRIDETRPFIAVRIAVLTVSDTRSLAQDKSGDLLASSLIEAGHTLAARDICTDDVDAIKSDIEALTQASHKMAEILYSQQAEHQGGEAGDGSGDAPASEEKSGKEDDNIVDADFEEVKK